MYTGANHSSIYTTYTCHVVKSWSQVGLYNHTDETSRRTRRRNARRTGNAITSCASPYAACGEARRKELQVPTIGKPTRERRSVWNGDTGSCGPDSHGKWWESRLVGKPAELRRIAGWDTRVSDFDFPVDQSSDSQSGTTGALAIKIPLPQ